MILSVHLADVTRRRALSALRRGLDPSGTSGLRYAEVAIAAPLSAGLLPHPTLTRFGLIAAWQDEHALDDFMGGGHRLAEQLASGWHVRLEPLRASGSWAGLSDFPRSERSVDDDEAVVVLTLGRLRPSRGLAFLRSSAAAEAQALKDPALLASTALARPPGFVATVSVWRTAAAMRDYAYGRSGHGHASAVDVQRRQPFHKESIFMRFRPLATGGQWDGRDPLAEAQLAAAGSAAASASA
jgi:hypothetical protein